MKKFIYVLAVPMLSLSVISCSDDDAEDFVCDVEAEAREIIVEQRIEDFEEDQEGSCQDLIDAIENFRELECTDDNEFASEFLEAQGVCFVDDIIN